MASIRRVTASIVSQNICRPCRTTATFRQATQQVLRTAPFQRRSIQPTLTSVRWHSAPASKSKVYEFDQVKKMSESPSEDQILIDVREPAEFEAGYIPSAINIPVKSQPDAFFLPEEEFEDRFGFSKPSTDKEVVFYCKSGVRSSAAAQLAQQHGYKNVSEYRGSWMDWQKQGGAAEKP